jgi:hypothetical protein
MARLGRDLGDARQDPTRINLTAIGIIVITINGVRENGAEASTSGPHDETNLLLICAKTNYKILNLSTRKEKLRNRPDQESITLQSEENDQERSTFKALAVKMTMNSSLHLQAPEQCVSGSGQCVMNCVTVTIPPNGNYNVGRIQGIGF